MPLWSLTKERVEKLLKQIGDKEIEIDALLKMSKEDLWKVDLDDFINEWRFQLDDEAQRQKKIAKMGRRASQKLRIGGAAPKKRKAGGYNSDDSDFGTANVARKNTAPRQPKPKPGGLLSEPLAKANQPKPRGPKAAAAKISKEVKPEKGPEDDVWMGLTRVDGATSEPPIAPIFQKTKAAAAAVKPLAPSKAIIPEDEDDDDDDEVIRKPGIRKPRAAASKPVSYGMDSDSDDNGDDLLFDVGKMVKGIDGASTDANTRPLFSNTSTSRPGSSHGLPKKLSTTSARLTDVDADDTDYSKLAPPTTKKGPAVTAKSTILSDEDDDSFDAVVTAAAPKYTASKAAAKTGTSKATKTDASNPTKPAPSKAAKPAAAKKTSAPPAVVAPPKKLTLSPAAKAYAAKQARKNKVIRDDSNSEEEDEVEKVANKIMDDDGDDGDDDDLPAARRPARRAAASAPKKTWVVGSGSEDEEDGEEEESAMFDGGEDSDDY